MRGSVRKRASTWTWYLDASPDPLTGKRRQASKGGFRTKRECEEALRAAIVQQQTGSLVKPSRRTLGGFLVDEWLPAVKPRLRVSAWSTYATLVGAYVIPVLGEVRLQGLTPAQLNLFYAQLLESGRRKHLGGLAPKTVKNVHRLLHRALKDAVRWGYLTRNVAEAVDAPKVRPAERQVWTPAQLAAFLQYVHGDRFYALWRLLVMTGMRRGELAGLRRGDVDFTSARITPSHPRVVVDHAVHVSEPKTERGRRSLALDAATLAALREHLARQDEERAVVGVGYQDSGLVFTKPDGTPIHPRLISEWFKQHSRAAGLPPIRLHDGRHSNATAALAAGVPVKVVSERLGHASVAFTLQVYGHVLPGMDEQAANALARLIVTDDRKYAGPSGSAPFVDNPLTTTPERPTGAVKGPSPGKEVTGKPPAQKG
jgi:integrase